MEPVEDIKIGITDYQDIIIDNLVVLHINKNDEGYSFDIYRKDKYDADDYDEGFVTGTWCHYDEVEDIFDI